MRSCIGKEACLFQSRLHLRIVSVNIGDNISGSNPERLLTAGTAAEPMLGRGGILLCPRGFPAVTVRLKLRDGAAKSPCTCGLDSEIYSGCRNLKNEEVYQFFTASFCGLSNREMKIIPTRSCQKYSKQFCLWDLAQSIGILFIIQMADAI